MFSVACSCVQAGTTIFTLDMQNVTRFSVIPLHISSINHSCHRASLPPPHLPCHRSLYSFLDLWICICTQSFRYLAITTSGKLTVCAQSVIHGTPTSISSSRNIILLSLLCICPRSGELRTQNLKSHLVRTQSLNVLPLKPGVGQHIAIHATLTARNFFLAYVYPSSPFTCIFPKPLPIFSCVGCG